MKNLGINPVLEFATRMRIELDKNAPEKEQEGWRDGTCLVTDLIWRLKEEVKEIEDAIYSRKSLAVILSECADVGNFAMMIADIYEEEKIK